MQDGAPCSLAGRDLGAMFGKGEGGMGALYVFVIVLFVSVSAIPQTRKTAEEDVSFCLQIEHGGCGSRQGCAERLVWGLVGRLSGKITREEETDI